MQKQFEDMGEQTGNLTGAEFAVFLQKETEKWAEVIKISGATVSD